MQKLLHLHDFVIYFPDICYRTIGGSYYGIKFKGASEGPEGDTDHGTGGMYLFIVFRI